MRKLKVLWTNRPKNSWIGGDYVQMERTADELRKLGYEIDIIETPLLNPAILVRGYDMIHTWNFSMDWAKYAAIMAQIHMKPLVVSMIYAETDNFIPYDKQQVMMDCTDSAIFLNEGEIARARRKLTIPDEKIHIVPNGIDEFWFKKPRIKQNEQFVLTVARLEPFKGQLAVAKACKKLGIRYVCAGESVDEEYAALLKKEGAELIGKQGPEELRKLYATCSVMCLASRAEIMSLSVMEALAQDCKVILTDHSEWKPELVSYCEWNNEESIEQALTKELNAKKEKKSHIVREMTWENVAKQISAIYDKTIRDYKKPEMFKINENTTVDTTK